MTKPLPLLGCLLVALLVLQLGCNYSSFQASSAAEEFIDDSDESPLLPGDINLGEVHSGGPYISFSLFRETAQAIFREDYEAAYSSGKQAIDAMRNEGALRNTFTLETMQFDDYMIHAILTAGSDERFYPREGTLQIISFRFVTNAQENVGTVGFEIQRSKNESVAGQLVSTGEDSQVEYGDFPADVEYKVLREKIRSIGEKVYLPLAKLKAEEAEAAVTEADGNEVEGGSEPEPAQDTLPREEIGKDE